MYCKKCGRRLADDVAFCPTCGTKTKNDSASKSAVSENWISKPNFASGKNSKVVVSDKKEEKKKESSSPSQISKDAFEPDKWYCRSYDDPATRSLIEKAKPKTAPKKETTAIDNGSSKGTLVTTGSKLPDKNKKKKKTIAIIAAVVGIILLLLIIAGAEEWDEEAAAASYSVSENADDNMTFSQNDYYTDSLVLSE